MARNRTSAGVVAWGGLLLAAVAGIALAVAYDAESDPPPPAARLHRTLPLPAVAPMVDTSVPASDPADQAPLSWPVVSGTLAGTKAAPVVAGTSIAAFEKYLADGASPAASQAAPSVAAHEDGRQERLVAAGAVVVFDAETPVEAVRYPSGRFAIFRPTDGPHKGKTLVARDADVRPS